jgi:hypothetical protein
VYHAIMRSDGTYKKRRFAGTKVGAMTLEVSRGSTLANLSLDLVSAQVYGNQMDATSDPTDTEFPTPTSESVYPTGPYTFRQTAGNLKIGSPTARTQYEDLSLKVNNVIDGRRFEAAHRTVLQFCGRSSTLDATIRLRPTPDDQVPYEAITAQTCSIGFTTGVTGTNLAISFNGANRIKSLPYDLPLNRVYMRKLTLQNLWDPTANSGAGQDVSFAMS